MRPSWDETWLEVARAVSKRSLCVRRQVGAVIVTSGNRPISTGYNGPPAGFSLSGSCKDFCPRSSGKGTNYDDCVAIHAEANALLFAARSQYESGTIYVSHLCCYDCAKLIANSGLSRVVMEFSNSSRNPADVIALLASSGIKTEITERPNTNA